MLTWLRRHWDKLVLASACALLVYLGGVATAHYELSPYPTIRAAISAAGDWHTNWRSYLGIVPSKHLTPVEQADAGVTVHVAGAPQPGRIGVRRRNAGASIGRGSRMR